MLKRKKNKGARTLSWQQMNCVFIISNNILTFYPLHFCIFYSLFFILFIWYDNIVSVYSCLCSLYLPSPLLSMVRAEKFSEEWACVYVDACHDIIAQFYFQCCLFKKKNPRIKKEHASFCTQHVTSLSWDITQSDGENLQSDVCQYYRAHCSCENKWTSFIRVITTLCGFCDMK